MKFKGCFILATRDLEIKNEEVRSRLVEVKKYYDITWTTLSNYLGVSREGLSRFMGNKVHYSYKTLALFEPKIVKLEIIAATIKETIYES